MNFLTICSLALFLITVHLSRKPLLGVELMEKNENCKMGFQELDLLAISICIMIIIKYFQ